MRSTVVERSTKRLLAAPRPPTAVLMSNDLTAIGALRAIHDAKLQVPDDISLVGFDDVDFCQHTEPTLSTIRLSRAELAETAMGALRVRETTSPLAVMCPVVRDWRKAEKAVQSNEYAHYPEVRPGATATERGLILWPDRQCADRRQTASNLQHQPDQAREMLSAADKELAGWRRIEHGGWSPSQAAVSRTYCASARVVQ